MSDEKEPEKKHRLRQKMERERGYVYPAWLYMVDKDADFMEAYDNIYEMVLTDGKALPARTRELIAIAILAFRGRESAVYSHMKRALRLGATRQELLEAVETMLVPGGAATFQTGVSALMKIEAEEEKEDQNGGAQTKA